MRVGIVPTAEQQQGVSTEIVANISSRLGILAVSIKMSLIRLPLVEPHNHQRGIKSKSKVFEVSFFNSRD